LTCGVFQPTFVSVTHIFNPSNETDMLHKTLDYRLRESRQDARRLMGMLLPSYENMEILYEHWLRANEVMLQGVCAVIQNRLRSLEREGRRRRREQVAVEGPEEAAAPRRGRAKAVAA
jgi:hypothetical protein